MKIELLSITQDAEKLIEKAGRTAYQSFDKTTNESAEKFIKMLISRGHESVIEHASATFKISDVSRTFSHQLVRHRLASYTQKSQRYVSEKEFDFIIPDSIKSNSEALDVFLDTMEYLKESYKFLQELGIRNEDARFCLPESTSTEIVVTANFREWRNIIKIRTDKAAQWEIQKVCIEILKILKQHVPSCFGDLCLEQEVDDNCFGW